MNIYREHILDHYQNPRNYGRLSSPSATADESNPVCGDQVHVEVGIRNGVVDEMRFEGGGCAISMAAASILSELIRGKTAVDPALPTDAEMLAEIAVPLSPTRTKCGLLALSGARKAVRQYTETDAGHETNQPRRTR